MLMNNAKPTWLAKHMGHANWGMIQKFMANVSIKSSQTIFQKWQRNLARATNHNCMKNFILFF
jgi:hypothetical protein